MNVTIARRADTRPWRSAGRAAVGALAAAAVFGAAACTSSTSPATGGSHSSRASMSSPPVTTSPTSPAATPSSLSAAFGCTEPLLGAEVEDIPGATSYACASSQRELVDWSTRFIDYGNGLRTAAPGPAPQFAQIVFFTSTGARDVYEARDKTAQAERAAETDAVLKRLDAIEGDLPDVIGPDWIESGNNVTVAEAAINFLTGHASTNHPQDGSGKSLGATGGAGAHRSAALSCTLDTSNPDAPLYVIDAGSTGFTGRVSVTLSEADRGIVFPVKPAVDVVQGGPESNRHAVPLQDFGASAEPDTCSVTPD